MADSGKPRFDYWHLYTDHQGMSRQARCAFTDFERRSISEPARPQWIGRRTSGPASTLVTVLPAGWIGGWHENPHPQWIIPLSGRWFVESMDGQRIEMGPGEVSLGADQDTRELNGHRGHLSGTVGDLPAVLWLIQLDEAGVPRVPCPFS